MTATVIRRGHVAGPSEAVWAVLADFGSLASWARDVEHSCLLRDGELAHGLVRRVQLGRTVLLETVDVVEPGRCLGYRIEGLPPVLRTVRNDWVLAAAGSGTDVVLTTTVDAGPRPPQQLVARLVARRMAKASDSMLAGLAAHLATGGTPVA